MNSFVLCKAKLSQIECDFRSEGDVWIIGCRQKARNYRHGWMLLALLNVGTACATECEKTPALYLRVEYHDQHGNGSPAGAIEQLQQQNLFPDLKAYTLLLGYAFAF